MATTVGDLTIRIGADSSQAEASFARVKELLAGFGIAVGATEAFGFLKDGVTKALEAERAFNQLKFAVETAGEGGWKAYSAEVQAATKATAEYARVTLETSQSALGRMVTATGDVDGSMKNLNLAFDLAAAKGMDVQAAALMIARAMEGNVTMLQRQLPLMKEFNKELDAMGATAEEKAAADIDKLHQVLDGASQAVGRHVEASERLNTMWTETKVVIGDATFAIVDYLKNLAVAPNLTEAFNIAIGNNRGQLAEGTRVFNSTAEAAEAYAQKQQRVGAVEADVMAIRDRNTASIIREMEATVAATVRKIDEAAATEKQTVATARLTEAKTILASLQAKADTAALLAGSPDDAIHRIKESFAGGAGTTVGGLQGLIGAAGQIKTTDAGQQADVQRLIQQLTESLTILATSQQDQANAVLHPVSAFEPSRIFQTITPSGGDINFSPMITINGSLADGSALAGLVRDQVVPLISEIRRRTTSPFSSTPSAVGP